MILIIDERTLLRLLLSCCFSNVSIHHPKGDGVEKEFEVERSFRHIGVAPCDDGVSLYGRFTVKYSFGRCAEWFEFKTIFLADVGHGGVEEEFFVAQEEDVVEERLHIVHLVCGDDERSVVGHVVGHYATELHL